MLGLHRKVHWWNPKIKSLNSRPEYQPGFRIDDALPILIVSKFVIAGSVSTSDCSTSPSTDGAGVDCGVTSGEDVLETPDVSGRYCL